MLSGTINTIKFALLAAVMIACWSSKSTAQFAKFVDESSQRSVVASNLFATDTQEKDYAWGDVDQDGDTDLIVVRKVPFTSSGGRRNVLLMNEGIEDGHTQNGVLVDRTSIYALAFLDMTNDRDVVLVDIDGNGWLDIVTATTLGGLDNPKSITHPRIYINLGNDAKGNWQGFVYDDVNRIPTFPFEPRFCGVAAGDIDNDGDQDLYFIDYDQGPYERGGDLNDRLLINVGGIGYFTDESSSRMTPAMLESDFGTSVEIADMNGDGWRDIVKCENGPVKVINNGGGGFFNILETLTDGSAYFVNVGDLNNDGMLDIIVTDDGTDGYFLNIGNGPNGMANFFPISFPISTNSLGGESHIADLNGDGWNDVIVTDVDIDISGCTRFTNILRNNANPPNVTFTDVLETANIPQNMLQGVHDAAIIDLNGDGWLDIILGRCSSSEIWIQHPYGVVFDFPQDLPSLVTPDEPFTIQAQLTPVGGTVAPDTATLHYAINYGPFTSVLMTDLGGNLYEVDLPATACLDGINFYFSAETVEENVYSTEPPDAPTSTYRADAATGLAITHLYNFEEGEDLSEWKITSDSSITSGEWEQADPNGTYYYSSTVAPEDDATPGPDNVMAFVTENGPPGGGVQDNDVDGGPTYLTSPSFDLQGNNASISYAFWAYWYNPNLQNFFTVEVSNDGNDWVLVEILGETGNEWGMSSFLVGDYVEPTENVQVRFSASDPEGPFAAFSEAGIDDFQVEQFTCDPACLGDLDNDGSVGTSDLLELFAQWGTAGPADFDGDGVVSTADLLILFANWGPCP